VTASRAAGLALGWGADRLLGDPARWHPVAGFGRLAAATETRLYADARARGVLHAALLTGGATGLGAFAERATRDRSVPHALVTAVATWLVLGGTSLEREATVVRGLLEAGDLPAARLRLTHLVGRDTARLDASGVSRAVVESVAENTSDAVVAPLLLGGLGGVPALLGYRAANTLDAMVGHRTDRHRRYGWASARLDDLLNLPGARLAGLLAAAGAPAVGGRPRDAIAAWREGAARHPSPNAGVVEAAFAGALGVRLGGSTTYASGTEERPRLGSGSDPGTADVARATRLAATVQAGAAAVAVSLALRPARRPRRPRRRRR